MTSWIESAEEKQRIRDTLTEREQKLDSENAVENHKNISPLINRLIFLIDRVDKISVEFRKPSIEIGQTHLDGDDTYEFYGSAYIQQRESILIIPIGYTQYMCWRRFYFKITDQLDKVKVIVSEKCTCDKNRKKSYGIREKFKFRISELNEDIAQNILDWLVFQISNEEFKRLLPINTHRNKNN